MITNTFIPDQEAEPAPDPDREAAEALRFIMAHVSPERWPAIAQALALIVQAGGYGRLTLLVRDGWIGPHPKVEISL